MLSGFKWLAACKFFGQFITWSITLIVIRLLTPSDYGLMAMASVIVAILALFNEFGLEASIIQTKEISQDSLQKIFAIIILMNSLLFCVLFWLSPLASDIYRESQLTPIIRLLSLQFLIMAFGKIPQALLRRNLLFKQQSIIELISNLSGGFVTLWLAYLGKGVWALVWGSLVIESTRTIALNIYSPFPHFPIFSFVGIKKHITFGGTILSERILWYLYSQMDVLIIGKLLGSELLGIYSVGKHLSSLPAEKIGPIINQVVFPTFSRIQEKTKQIVSHTLTGIDLICYFAFPIFFGISCVAQELIVVAIGDQWLSAAPIITWRSLVIPLGMISGIIASVLKAVGKPNISFKNMIFACIIMPVSFFIGCKWGITGVSIAWVIARPIHLSIVLYLSGPHIGIRMKDVLSAIGKPLAGSAVMYSAVVLLRYLFNGNLPPFLSLIVLSIIGALVYICFLICCDRKKTIKIFNGIKNNL